MAEPEAARLLEAIGFPADPEMAETPRRLVEWLVSFRPPSGPPPSVSVCATQSTAPVRMDGIRFYSLCAHHLLPFFGVVSIAYMPDGTLAGLGALSRAVTWFARRPQVQERLGEQLADHLMGALCVEISQDQQPTVRTWAVRGVVPPDWLR